MKNTSMLKLKYVILEFPAPKKLTTRNAVRDKQTIHNQWQKHKGYNIRQCSLSKHIYSIIDS